MKTPDSTELLLIYLLILQLLDQIMLVYKLITWPFITKLLVKNNKTSLSEIPFHSHQYTQVIHITDYNASISSDIIYFI